MIGILAGINSLFLPTETLGLTLNQSGDLVTNGTTQIVNNDNQTDDPNNSTSTQWYFSSIDAIKFLTASSVAIAVLQVAVIGDKTLSPL